MSSISEQRAAQREETAKLHKAGPAPAPPDPMGSQYDSLMEHIDPELRMQRAHAMDDAERRADYARAFPGITDEIHAERANFVRPKRGTSSATSQAVASAPGQVAPGPKPPNVRKYPCGCVASGPEGVVLPDYCPNHSITIKPTETQSAATETQQPITETEPEGGAD